MIDDRTAALAEAVILKSKAPEKDGEVNVYYVEIPPGYFAPGLVGKTRSAANGGTASVRSLLAQPKSAQKYKVIFINGMQGSPAKHRAQACAVSVVSGKKVWGVYNAPVVRAYDESSSKFRKGASVLIDVLKCGSDKLTSRMMTEVRAGMGALKALASGSDEAIQIRKSIKDYLGKDNPPAGALFDLLATPGFEDARIVAHSQGNIITCNALNGLAVLKGDAALGKLRVYAVGSPVSSWPATAHVEELSFNNDFITYLGLRRRPSNSKDYLRGKASVTRTPAPGQSKMGGTEEVIIGYQKSDSRGALLSHSFYIYLEAYWDLLAREFQ